MAPKKKEKKFRCLLCNSDVDFGIETGNYESLTIICLKCKVKIKLSKAEVEALG